MKDHDALFDLLTIWKDGQNTPHEPHLTDQQLYTISTPTGFEKCDTKTLDHLSICPKCIQLWQKWQLAHKDCQQIDTVEHSAFDSFGLREAAASKGESGALTLRSTCDKYTLQVYPQQDDATKGMITLNLLETSLLTKTPRLIIKDAKGTTVMSGELYNGRLVKTCNSLTSLDFSMWTVSEQQSDENQT